MTYARLMEHAEDIRREAVEATLVLLDGPETSVRKSVEREFADVPDAFRPLTGFPDPARYDGLADGVDDVLRGLSTGDGMPADPEVARFNGTVAALRSWSGTAAERFRAGFADPWPALVRNQFTACAVLRSALRAEQDIWARARQDADQIAEQGLAAIMACRDCTRTEWTITFTVVASVAAVAAVPVGGAIALAAGGVAGVAQVAAATGPDEAPRSTFSGDDPAEIVSRLREAIGLLRGHIRQQRAGVGAALRTTRMLMTDRPELFGWS
ncbi:hypothetical protein [Dactylosporangium sp. CA-092794]|uniref:hypothetical protein n=1 Tax=Dactylosporangium sp. CA-092794 TaxID=3239929 RepID=UPI003D928CD7